jgi:hypothetical protein
VTANALGGEGSWEVSLISSLQGHSIRTGSGRNEQHHISSGHSRINLIQQTNLLFKELKAMGIMQSQRGVEDRFRDSYL